MNKVRIREIERASIRDFLTRHQQYLRGRVLDFGCGLPNTCVKPQPYRDLIPDIYVPFDKGYRKPEGMFDTILLTQVVQFLCDLSSSLTDFHQRTKYLVMTYPHAWEEVDPNEVYRFTRRGMDTLLGRAGFKVLVHEPRWSLPFEDFEIVGGYGVVAESQRGTHHART